MKENCTCTEKLVHERRFCVQDSYLHEFAEKAAKIVLATGLTLKSSPIASSLAYELRIALTVKLI
jgi:hypothetical protein